MLRVVFVFIWLVFGLVCEGQNSELYSFIDGRSLVTEQINASNINAFDSNAIGIDFQINNFYNIDDLQKYRFGFRRSMPKSTVKLNYSYFKENVFINQTLKIGVQKRLSKRLLGNLSLGGEIRNFRNNESSILFGFALNYQLSKTIFIHTYSENMNLDNQNSSSTIISGLIYKVSDELGLFSQIEISDDYEYRIGAALTVSSIKIQLSHSIYQEDLNLSLRWRFKLYALSISYTNHPILRHNTVVVLSFKL